MKINQKQCRSCGDLNPTKAKTCDDCKWGTHGLKWSELLIVATAQNFTCPILGTPFFVDYDNKKIIDGDPKSKKKQRVCVDHCHDTLIIRGLLSDMGNMVVGGYDRGRYGTLSRPKEVIDYIDARFAQNHVGEKLFR